jgi:hypothetical protein
MSVPERQAIETVARKHGVSSQVAKGAATRVMDSLTKNNWYATPDAEIRHASDWNGERR